jgi:ABC-type ATPase involved in cell division
VARLLAAVGLDEEVLERPIAQHTTGERQRIALVRPLIDEPTGPLDVASAALVEELVRFQMLAGKSVLLASHDGALVGRLAHARLQLAPTVRAPRSAKGPGP